MENDTQFKGSFRVGPAEYIRLTMHISMKRTLIFAAVIAAFQAVFMIVTRINRTQSTAVLILIAVGSAIAIALAFIALCHLLSVVRIRSMFKKGELKDLGATLTLDENVIHSEGRGGEADIEYKDVKEVAETAKDLFVITVNRVALVLPKEQLNAPEDAQTLRRIFRAALPATALKLKG